MLVEEVLRKFPNVLKWFVESYSPIINHSTGEHKIEMHLVGPWGIPDVNRVHVLQEVTNEELQKLGEVVRYGNSTYFGPMCACLVYCLLISDELKL